MALPPRYPVRGAPNVGGSVTGMSAGVAWISYAPVKGLALVQPQSVDLTERGVPGDRRFHVIDARGRLTNGKRLGVLQQVHPAWDEAASRLTLRFPHGAVVEGGVELGEANVTIFYGRPVQGHLVLGPFAEALSEHAGEPLRLVQPDKPGAGIDRGRGGAVSLLSRASLEPLRVAAGADAPVDERRFRMLFGVDGVEAHAEDGWIGRDVRIGEAVIRPRGHVGRCLITSRDPETGRPDMDTLGALRRYRAGVEATEPLPFGVYGEVRVPGRVAVGDAVALA
jgi:uncharacterized protein YcbX